MTVRAEGNSRHNAQRYNPGERETAPATKRNTPSGTDTSRTSSTEGVQADRGARAPGEYSGRSSFTVADSRPSVEAQGSDEAQGSEEPRGTVTISLGGPGPGNRFFEVDNPSRKESMSHEEATGVLADAYGARTPQQRQAFSNVVAQSRILPEGEVPLHVYPDGDSSFDVHIPEEVDQRLLTAASVRTGSAVGGQQGTDSGYKHPSEQSIPERVGNFFIGFGQGALDTVNSVGQLAEDFNNVNPLTAATGTVADLAVGAFTGRSPGQVVEERINRFQDSANRLGQQAAGLGELAYNLSTPGLIMNHGRQVLDTTRDLAQLHGSGQLNPQTAMNAATQRAGENPSNRAADALVRSVVDYERIYETGGDPREIGRATFNVANLATAFNPAAGLSRSSTLVDDAARVATSNADDVARVATSSADDVARGATSSADETANAAASRGSSALPTRFSDRSPLIGETPPGARLDPTSQFTLDNLRGERFQRNLPPDTVLYRGTAERYIDDVGTIGVNPNGTGAYKLEGGRIELGSRVHGSFEGGAGASYFSTNPEYAAKYVAEHGGTVVRTTLGEVTRMAEQGQITLFGDAVSSQHLVIVAPLDVRVPVTRVTP